jgi:single-stranded DNA-binding protein
VTAQIAVRGRLGGDPERPTAASGVDWCSVSLAVDLNDNRTEDGPATWMRVVAFGRVAETLARHCKGDLLAVSGRLQVGRWKTAEGVDREPLRVIVDSIISARTVRPGACGRQTRDAGAAK